MNFHLVARMLSRITFLIAATMVFSLPWAFPTLSGTNQFELRGFWALVGSMVFSCLVRNVWACSAQSVMLSTGILRLNRLK